MVLAIERTVNMTRQLAKIIAHFFYNRDVISQENIDTYTYGYEIMLISGINWGTILIIMLITSSFIESLLYMISFITLRHHTGGYHANSHRNCFLLSIASYLSVLLTIYILPEKYALLLSLFFLSISLFSIFLFSPVENRNLPVSFENQRKHRQYSLFFATAFALCSLLFIFKSYTSLSLSLSSSLFQVSIALLVGVYKNKREEDCCEF